MTKRSIRILASILGALACVPATAGAQAGPYDDQAPIDDGTEASPRRRYATEGTDVQTLAEAQRDRRSITLGGGSIVVPETYVVHRGDTLWDICGFFFHNPWRWPRVWSLNPQVTNPHWIYPRDVVRLLSPGAEASPTARPLRARSMLPDSVYLRDEAFIDDQGVRQSGIVSGSPEEHMLLSTHDEIYVQFDEGQHPRVGEEYSIYRELRDILPPGVDDPDQAVGSLVRIFGAARIESYDRERGLARARITEALDPIERGFHVGPIGRRFEVVPPRRNERDVSATIVWTLHDLQMAGNQQIVFLDRGREDGVRLGNRFFAVRRLDEWRAHLFGTETEAGATVPDEGRQPDEELPLEVVAELRVVDVRDTTATALVTRAVHEVEVGERAEMRRGY